jgi:hypothetical protein
VTRKRLGRGLTLLFAVAIAGCTTPTVSPSTVAEPSTAIPASGSEPPDASTSTGAGSQVAQTDTAWGRIWDDLPRSFPTIAGATPGGASAHGPASADLVVEGRDPKDIIDVLQTQLEQVGFATAGKSGPLEDGGYVLDLTGETSGCQVQVSVAPLGGLTSVTVLYGADCPFD